MMRVTKVVVGAGLLGMVNAECPNACSSHGVCTNYDMCQCYRNWMANDCSERVCQFGLAHVDTPKGDLDASSGVLSGPGTTVITNSEVYPYGTSEQFPNMVDSQGNTLADSAHYYMECSNKGICDREAGTCECFPGYEGSACQRASCPSSGGVACSGHGTCNSIKEIAKNDYDNIYELWDEHATLGCVCDAGYYGADCSLRRCKWGADPLYADDSTATPRVANWTYGFYDKNIVTGRPTLSGNYSLVFYDVHGEDWRTEAISHNAGCDEIVAALEDIPNDVIPDNSVLCLQQDASEILDASVYSVATFHQIYTIAFPQNPGKLRQVEVDIHLDGPRPTLVTNETDSTLTTFVYANGYHGEYVDYVSDHCEGVLVTLDSTTASGEFRLAGLDAKELILLKRCLGDADGDATFSGQQANEVYNWDHGDEYNPHLIKLVEATAEPYSRLCNSTTTYFSPMNSPDWCDNYKPAGFYAPLIWRSSYFEIFAAPYNYYSASTEFRVFTTTGRLEKITRASYSGCTGNGDCGILQDNVNLFNNKVYYVSSTGTSDAIDCETRTHATETNCLQKGDLAMFFSTDSGYNSGAATILHNMYTVEKISTSRNATNEYAANTEIVLNMGNNFNHIDEAYAYKFIPPTNGGVSWAAECSDRGVCDSSSGVCQCFTGYTSDDCSVQSTLAK